MSSSNIYFNAGSVGIGSSAPAYALDVNGSVRVSGVVSTGAVSFLVRGFASAAGYYSTTSAADVTSDGLFGASCYHQNNTTIGSDLKFTGKTS